VLGPGGEASVAEACGEIHAAPVTMGRRRGVA
jgi:hypothetical protein